MILLTSSSNSLSIILGGIVALSFYFLPTILAISRKKPNKVAIGALNFLLGWSIIGWVVALVWSLSNNSPSQNVIITQSEKKVEVDKFGELEKLNNLLEKGVISKEEFMAHKERILNS